MIHQFLLGSKLSQKTESKKRIFTTLMTLIYDTLSIAINFQIYGFQFAIINQTVRQHSIIAVCVHSIYISPTRDRIKALMKIVAKLRLLFQKSIKMFRKREHKTPKIRLFQFHLGSSVPASRLTACRRSYF